MAPLRRPFPRSIADASQEGRPYGRWEERLAEAFAAACEPLAAEAGGSVDPSTLKWFPDRSWGGRVYVPVSGSAAAGEDGEDGEAAFAEFFGWVSFDPGSGDDAEPSDLRTQADFTDVTAAENPEWRIDLNDDVIGTWRTDGGRGGDVTLIWGLPLVRGAVAATAELDDETLDQSPVADGRFTLVAADAVSGFGDDELYLKVKLWDRRLRELASESLYDDPEELDEPDEPDASDEAEQSR